MRAARGQAGLTLIELLVSMALVTVVVMATMTAFVSFNKNERITRIHNEATDEARLTVERLSSQLRNLASPTNNAPEAVEKAEPFDLVFLTVDAVKPEDSENARNIKRVRYCVGEVTDGKAPLIRQQQVWLNPLPPPSFSTSGCPNSSWGNSTVVASDVINTAEATPVPVFTYTPDATPTAEISAVRAELMVDTNPDVLPRAVSLGSGVFLRNQNRVPVASCTAIAAGTGTQIALNGSASSDPEGFNLREYQWIVNGAPIDKKGVVALWDAETAGTYNVQLRVTDQGDLDATASCDPGTVTFP
jgi:prepilin-type N-terminal cleavage/methylation domain-containing protein